MTVTKKWGETRVELSLHPADAALDETQPGGLHVLFDFESSTDPNKVDQWIWLTSDSLKMNEPGFTLTIDEAIELAYALIETVKENTNAIS